MTKTQRAALRRKHCRVQDKVGELFGWMGLHNYIVVRGLKV